MITIEVPHFSTYAVLIADNVNDKDESSNPAYSSVESNNDQKIEGKKLPKTATNTFNWMAIGALLILIGVVTIFIRNRKIVK